MQVTEEEAQQLRKIRDNIETEVEREGSDFKGVYDRLVKKISEKASEGRDIGLRGMNYSYFYQEHKRYIPEQIREVALNKFARYIFYDLERGERTDLKEQIKRDADNEMKSLSDSVKRVEAYGAKVILNENVGISNWFLALEHVASNINYYHWGTPLEAVE